MNAIFSMLTPFQWGAVAVAIAAVLWINRGMFAGFKWPTTTTTTGIATTTAITKPGVPTRRQALDYLDALYSYFEAEKCKEGMEAVKLAVTHSFHEHPEA